MIHPLLRLAATQPHLLGDHVEAYAALVGEEVGKVSTSLLMRVGLYLGAVAMFAIGLVLVAQSVLLLRLGAAGPAPDLEEIARAALLVACAATGAALARATAAHAQIHPADEEARSPDGRRLATHR